jgi:6-phosphogluconolactonase
MELVGAPVPELRNLLTTSFEQWDAEGDGNRSCAISGGATAMIFLPALRSANVDWQRITLFWGDERAVPPDDPESNFGLAERMLLTPLGARAPRAIRMPAETASLEQAALWYDDALATELENGPLDLAILGVGEDGHICSLFPGHKALLETNRRTVAIEDAPKPPPRRLSLTLRFVMQTKRIWLIAIGPRKLPVLQAAIEKTNGDTPLAQVLRKGRDVTVFTDQTLRRR